MKKFLTHKTRLILVFLYILNSHWVIPTHNAGKDYLFFTKWDLFAFKSVETVNDISWDGGKTFLYRDHRDSASRVVDTFHLFLLVFTENIDLIKIQHIDRIKSFCNCEDIEFFRLSGSMHDHYVLKKELAVKERESL